MILNIDGCLAKLASAKAERDTLKDYILETFSVETNLPTIGSNFNAQTKEHILYVSFMPDLQWFFGWVSTHLGNIFHNLHSALDHLAYQLAEWNTDGHIKDPKKVYFPIVDNEMWFQSRCPKDLGEIHLYHRAVIKGFQPYVGTDFLPLGWLRDFSNTDKHRLLTEVMIPAEDLTGQMEFTIFALVQRMIGAYATNITMPSNGPIKLGAELARFTVPFPILESKAEMARLKLPHITFPKPQRDIIDVVDEMWAAVMYVVSELYKLPEPRRSIVPIRCWTPPKTKS
jgi:hypothetical protein